LSVEWPSSARDVTARTSITVSGRPQWRSAAVNITPAANVDLGVLQLSRVREITSGTTYTCGGEQVEFDLVGDRQILRARGSDYSLTQAPSASGARYVAIGAPETSFWSKGESAMVVITGETLPECVKTSVER